MQEWADYLDKLKAGADVIPILREGGWIISDGGGGL